MRERRVLWREPPAPRAFTLRSILLHPPAELHVWIPEHSGVAREAGVRHHRDRRHLPPLGLLESVPDMLEHVARCLPPSQALVVWESALQRGTLTPAELRRIPWRSLVARRLASEASSQSESVLETLLLHALRDAGIDMRQQVQLLGHAVDGLIGETLVIQADGYAFHSDPVARQRDLRHDVRLALAGFTVLRFGYDDLVRQMPQVIESIRRAIAQGLHRGRVNA